MSAMENAELTPAPPTLEKSAGKRKGSRGPVSLRNRQLCKAIAAPFRGEIRPMLNLGIYMFDCRRSRAGDIRWL